MIRRVVSATLQHHDDHRFPVDFTKYDCDKWSQSLPVVISHDDEDMEQSLKELLRAHEDMLRDNTSHYDDIAQNIKPARAKINELRGQLLPEQSYFEVSVSLINQGRFATAIKAPAILRIYIGFNRHVDLELILNNHHNSSEITASGTKFVVFHSDPITFLPEINRTLVNRYWNADNAAKLIIEDIYSKEHMSSHTVFADGLYRRHIYDKLIYAANRDQNRIFRSKKFSIRN